VIVELNQDLVLRFTTGWNEAVGVRLAAALFGLVVISLVVKTVWRRDFNALVSGLWLAAGGLSLAFSLWPQVIIDSIIQTPYEIRVRIITGGISILVLLVTLEAIRSNRLQERYALLWLATAAVILLSVMFPRAVMLFRAVTGMKYETALMAVAFTFLVLVAFHFSISISFARTKQARIAQRVAILEERLRQVENLAQDTVEKGNEEEKT